MAHNEVQMKKGEIKEALKVLAQKAFEKQPLLPKRPILIVLGRKQTSFKCCGKIYEGQKTCLVSRYKYKTKKKQTGTDITTTNIDPIRMVTTIHTGVTPARQEKTKTKQT